MVNAFSYDQCAPLTWDTARLRPVQLNWVSVVSWLYGRAFDSQFKGHGFEPHQGSGHLCIIGQNINTQLPRLTHVYKWAPVQVMCEVKRQSLMAARIHMHNYRTGNLVVKSAEYGLP